MLRPSQLACARAALYLPRADGGPAAARADSKLDLAERKAGIGPLSGLLAVSLPPDFSSQLHNTLPMPVDSLRRVARPPRTAVPGYHELDARIAWQPGPGAEPALSGRHLLHARHPASGAAGGRQLAERGVFASASLRF